ncbi:hypothetical protein ENSA5_03630 [Enhygromyxa salina]|uniref:Uncharacterized protein n=1 Tax=Enhygromyxa salina TaxID=215803 RepID=A0A2S9YJT8_9BACT|nr:hypothetical protein [Enhygromyxa salina]PRQ05373.1 hypothetical protein ENSA5_03630 [Enhygromyxa salina]
MGGYNSQQYGQCNGGGGDGSVHWRWDSHPDGHGAPDDLPGDVVSPGRCGDILGSFTDGSPRSRRARGVSTPRGVDTPGSTALGGSLRRRDPRPRHNFADSAMAPPSQ